MASVVLKETKERKEKTASQDLKEIWASKATGVNLDQPDPEERMALKVPKVAQVFQVTLVRSDQLVRRVNLVFLGCLDIQEDKDQRDLKVSKASLVPTERKELEEQEESPAHVDREDQRGHEEKGDPGDQQEKLDQRVTPEMMDLQDLPVRGVCLDLKAQLDSLAQKALLDQQAKTGCPDIQAKEERLVSKERRALLVLQVWSGLRDQRVRQDKWVTEVTLDHQAPLENRVFQELQEKRVLRGTLVLLDLLVKTDHLDQEVFLEREACLGPWELMV